MKKALIIGLILSFSSIVYGQYKQLPIKEMGKVKKEFRSINCDKSTKPDLKLPNSNTVVNGSDEISREAIGKSGNVFSVIYPEQRCVFYDERSDHIIFTHGADSLTYTDALSSSSIITTYIDGDDLVNDQFWDYQVSLNVSAELHGNASPSGIIYNPDNSENFEETYTVVAGPDIHQGTFHNYFASAKMDNSNHDDEYMAWEGENDWARSSMTIVNNEVYIFGQDFQNIGDFGVNQTLKHYQGTTTDPSNGFDWEINAVSPDWLINETESYAYALYTTYSAWKKDGSIGYMWMIGVTNESSQYGVYQPQVYYTTDGGESWDYIELNLEDNSFLQQYLPAWEDENGNPQTVRPSFLTTDRTYPGVVDLFGQLHLFSNVYGSTKGDVTHPDEANWVNEEYLGGIIFDFIIKPEGLEQIEFVDYVYTEVIDSVFGTVGWNHRLQAAKTIDEHNVIAIWSDQDDSFDGKLNFPDLMGFSYCPTFDQNFGSTNFSEGTLYEGFYFFPYISEYIPEGYVTYGVIDMIPITTSVSPGEFASNCPLESITHSFVMDAHLNVCIGDIDENSTPNLLFSVDQNKPNPVKTKTSIMIYSEIVGAVFVELSNSSGQVLFVKNKGLIYNEMEVEFDLSDAEPGLYFYRVKIGEESITKKMIVE
ncbi:MAG: T9SS type A sorting domain-containing protein [Bacteroidales bacterium]|nr:T9SS type A sorting domain-containing protein [Bacteroidales bacterium]